MNGVFARHLPTQGPQHPQRHFWIFGLQVTGSLLRVVCRTPSSIFVGLQVIGSLPRVVCRIPSKTTSRRGVVYDFPAWATHFSNNLGGGLSFPFCVDPALNAREIPEGSILVLDPNQPQPIQPVQRSKRPVVAYVRYSANNITHTVADVQRMETAADTCIATIQAHPSWELVAVIVISHCDSTTGLYPFVTCSIGSLYEFLVNYSQYA